METDKEKLRQWVENWKTTGDRLDELRRDKLRNGDINKELSALSSAFREAIKNRKPTVTSGLVEFQRLIKNL